MSSPRIEMNNLSGADAKDPNITAQFQSGQLVAGHAARERERQAREWHFQLTMSAVALQNPANTFAELEPHHDKAVT